MGSILTLSLNFLLIAWVLFIAIKVNKLKKDEPAAPRQSQPQGQTPDRNQGSFEK
jgi:large-conductance mechanosensitive channel